MDTRPTIGRIVLVRAKSLAGDVDKPLLITDVHSEVLISGVLFDAFGPASVQLSRVSPGGALGQWRWPDQPAKAQPPKKDPP